MTRKKPKRLTERQAFEAWMKRHNRIDASYELDRHPDDGSYIGWFPAAQWEVWQASARRRRK